jgi:hypothetical protein
MQSPETEQQDIVSSLGIHQIIEPRGSLSQPARWLQCKIEC